MMKQKVSIVWFKRDLRIHDHAPLVAASQQSTPALPLNIPTLPLYIVEPHYWQQKFASRRHWHFIHDCLVELRQDCERLGQALVVRVGEATQVLQQLSNEFEITSIHAHEETGNMWTYERDKAVIAWCSTNAIPLKEYPCNGVVRRLQSRDDWSKIRNARMAEELIPKPQQLLPVTNLAVGTIPDKADPLFGDDVPGVTQIGGRRAAIQTLKSFLQTRGKNYIYTLSAPGPSEMFCSRLSPHLTWGTLSTREVLKSTQNRRDALLAEESRAWKRNLAAFSSRLSWRCHFIQKIEDQPTIETHCMHRAFEGIRESEHNENYYQAWAQGNTGYPLIDACMRHLIHQGWLTFRMRAMLVSFASYHLWLDWRVTGYHLAQLFTDYEPGIHYSQLQMQSGVTGINAVRIYNPIKQSQEHDPEGEFIKQWIPTLEHVTESWIHEPWNMPLSLQKEYHCILGKDYPHPIVDHKQALKAAREKISLVRKQEAFKTEANQVYNKLGSRKSPSKRKRKATEKENAKQQLDLPI